MERAERVERERIVLEMREDVEVKIALDGGMSSSYISLLRAFKLYSGP